jgi:hypothetical protein
VPQTRSRWLRHLPLLAWISVGTPLLAELGIRVVQPTPPIQVIRLDRMRWHDEVNGVQVWREEASPEQSARVGLDCVQKHPNAPVVVVFGSSVLGGAGVGDDEVFHRRLASEKAACVVSFAASAYTFETSLAVAERYLPQIDPDLVVVEVWRTAPYTYDTVGRSVYGFRTLGRAPDDIPNVAGLPSALNRTLFVWSRVYEFATLTLAKRGPDDTEADWRRLAEDQLPALDALTEAPLLVLFAPALDERFGMHKSRRGTGFVEDPYAGYSMVEASGVVARYLWVEDLLADESVFDLRLDPCCHYNAQGHKALALALSNEL